MTLSEAFLTREEFDTLFFRIPELCDVHQSFLKRLEPKLANWSPELAFGDCFRYLVIKCLVVDVCQWNCAQIVKSESNIGTFIALMNQVNHNSPQMYILQVLSCQVGHFLAVIFPGCVLMTNWRDCTSKPVISVVAYQYCFTVLQWNISLTTYLSQHNNCTYIICAKSTDYCLAQSLVPPRPVINHPWKVLKLLKSKIGISYLSRSNLWFFINEK